MRESFQRREGDMEVRMMLRILSWSNGEAIWAQKMKPAQSAQK